MAIKRVKKLIFICLLLLVVICLSACSEIRAMTTINEDGTVDELVYITLDEEKIIESSYDLDEVKTRIESIAKNEANNLIFEFKKKLAEDLLNLNIDAETKKILLSYQDGIQVVGSNSWNDENTYIVGLKFENVDVYRYYYNIIDKVETTSLTEEHFLYDTIYYYTSDMFSDYNDLYNKIYSEITSIYPEFINQENTLLYTYSTDLRREHSNANYITEIDRVYYHTWEVDPNNMSNEIVFYYNIANRANCIMLCIGISLVVCAILLIIGFAIDKKNEKINNK